MKYVATLHEDYRQRLQIFKGLVWLLITLNKLLLVWSHFVLLNLG